MQLEPLHFFLLYQWNRTFHSHRFLFFSLTWCMAGSFTPIELWWILRRPWSACSLAFLTMKRSVWDYNNCSTADLDSRTFFSVFLPSDPAGSGLQSSAWSFSHRLLHCVHDLCGAEPVHLCNSGGIHSRADPSQGNWLSLTYCRIAHIVSNNLSITNYLILIELCILLNVLPAIRRGGDCGPDVDETLQFVWTEI